MGDPNHPFQLEAFAIFQTAWLNLQNGQRQSSPSPKPTNEIVEQASDELVAAVVAKNADDAATFLYSTLSAIVDHAAQSPASLDLMLQAYVHAANKLPAETSCGHGKGTQGAIGDLNWWIYDEAGRFDPPLEFSGTGKPSPEDQSNPKFQESEVKESLDGVLDRAQEWRQERVSCTLMSAAMGRCYALNLVRGSEGRQVHAFVSSALNLGEKKWSEAQFVGAAIMLRACAKSLGADAAQVSEWREKLETLLCGENVSFTIKSHAEVGSKNPTLVNLANYSLNIASIEEP